MMRRPPQSLTVVRDPTPELVNSVVDWSSWYLTDEADMGEGGEQACIITDLVSSIRAMAEARGWSDVHIAGDQFFAWVEAEPLVRVSPDVYVLDGVWERPLPKSFQTWLPGHRAPRFALEVVSEDWRKDYEAGPPKYALLGVEELVIFDPEAVVTPREGRLALQIYRRATDQTFVRVFAGSEPAWSAQLEAWLHVERVGSEAASVFLAEDEAGARRRPTYAEWMRSERAAKEAERAAKEAERAAKEAERAAKEAERAARVEAEAEVARLRALLEG